MNIIDTHAHIYSEEFQAEIPEMLQRAKAAGVSKILMPAIDSSAHEAMLNLEAQNEGFCNSMMGLHPCYVKENYLDELRIVESYLSKRKFIAVGEIGLDFYWDKTFTTQQYDAFNKQIEMALHYNIPIAIHSRNATDECIEVVSKHQQGQLRGVFHCFSGDAGQAKKITDLNFYIGIGGVVTFKNAGLDKVIPEIGLESIVIETDAPYLAPVPFRGKKNEPAYCLHIIEKIATILKKENDEVCSITTQNAKLLFNI